MGAGVCINSEQPTDTQAWGRSGEGRGRALLHYLRVPVEGGVVQGGAPAAVRHVDAAQQRDDDLGAAQGVVGGRHVQRRLPVLVPGVHVGRVTDQHADRLLWTGGEVCERV